MRKMVWAAGALSATTLGLVIAGGLAAGSGGGSGGDGAARAADAAPRTATGTLEQLAAKAECAPDLQTNADELRQAKCQNEDGRFVLATFATDRGERDWLNAAKDYGGTYLVGRKWVAVGDPAVVGALRGRLGGTVERASHHSP
ncbi:hypothetical protein [Streptomyces flavofungini]|uniref:Lipoprotein n=1 Tax=Streptomyces flavofungini TaxID=68200 RepID=A0ABS0XDL2_9ACTN|nr:hypothetical protein [Streptomyces flavofungini]MBJ3811308.1 hypothetical protein [Streptomyces flavofungini]GHC66232.1 hypothetical protein GCM10010349_38700 [Streptomyces flavofungini]